MSYRIYQDTQIFLGRKNGKPTDEMESQAPELGDPSEISIRRVRPAHRSTAIFAEGRGKSSFGMGFRKIEDKCKAISAQLISEPLASINGLRGTMRKLTPLESLSFFEQNLPKFLSKDKEITNLIVDLRKSLQDRKSANFHANALKSGKNFIKHIISRSIEYLSDESDAPKNRAIKNIKEYIDAFTLFEEMLFGLDSKYRDHTLHSLWVYLYGHEFIKCIGGYNVIEIAGQMSITYSKGNQPKFLLATQPVKGTREHLEAMWGMISILHDMGYPIEAISNKPHEVFGRILDPFAIDFTSILNIDLGSRITLLHQSVCDLLSNMYRPQNTTAEETESLYRKADEKCTQGLPIFSRPPTTTKAEAIELEFRIASVDKIHSAWSAILAFKNIAYLHGSDYHGGGNRDYLTLLTKRDILYSIVHHTCEG